MMLDRTAHKPPKCYMDCEQDVVDWIYEPLSEADRVRIFANKAKSLDCTIMDLADDIAYGVHDLEDAISLGLVSNEQMLEDIPSSYWDEFLNRITERHNPHLTNVPGSINAIFLSNLFSGHPATINPQIA